VILTMYECVELCVSLQFTVCFIISSFFITICMVVSGYNVVLLVHHNILKKVISKP
jgi:hypothetical protein